MVLQVTAIEYMGRAESGRSHPMLCRCQAADGCEFDVYIKYAGFHEQLSFEHLTGELIGNLLARDLALPAAEPCIVRLDPDFIDTLPEEAFDTDLLGEMTATGAHAFGSVAVSPVRRWSENDLLHTAQRFDASMLYLFDTISENSDRGIRNPNLLVSGGRFHIIDFGHCFQRCHSKGDEEKGLPWQNGAILNHFEGDLMHVLLGQLRPMQSEFIDTFTLAFQGVTDDTLESYISSVPKEWGEDTSCRIMDYLLLARNNVESFGARVREVCR